MTRTTKTKLYTALGFLRSLLQPFRWKRARKYHATYYRFGKALLRG
jgi:hypothetical protein